jgi:putative glutamine amidotransferase
MTGPRIGVTRSLAPNRAPTEIPTAYRRYHDRVREAGGEPVDLHAALGLPPERLLDGLDGLVICGGGDINPARYGEPPAPEVEGVDDARDALELGLIAAALAADLPVLAICRGHQALNVACGGSLLQHIAGDGHRALDDGTGTSRSHEIALAEGSRLFRLLGRRRLMTNSRHHQAVTPDRIAPGLVATAWSPDGLVEGLESPSHRWVMGVQWHPEREEVQAAFRPLFEDFVRAAALAGRHAAR